MSIQIVATVARERSTIYADVTFRDEDDALVVPTAATWTLTRGDGSVVNSRSAVALSALASTKTIELSGADLAIDEEEEGDEVLRYLTVEAVYTSGVFGSGKLLKDSVGFHVRALPGVSA